MSNVMPFVKNYETRGQLFTGICLYSHTVAPALFLDKATKHLYLFTLPWIVFHSFIENYLYVLHRNLFVYVNV